LDKSQTAATKFVKDELSLNLLGKNDKIIQLDVSNTLSVLNYRFMIYTIKR